MNRSEKVIEQALWGLFEHYGCLSDGTLCKEIAACVIVPDTGNEQADYENVRNQVEAIARRHESPA